MSVYVDASFDWPAEAVKDAQAKRLTEKHGQWCHMMADTEEELISFARKIGLKKEWLQKAATADAHFDLVPTRRAKALELGAIELTRAEFYSFRKHKRTGNVMVWIRGAKDPDEEFRQEYEGTWPTPEPMPTQSPEVFKRSQWV